MVTVTVAAEKPLPSKLLWWARKTPTDRHSSVCFLTLAGRAGMYSPVNDRRKEKHFVKNDICRQEKPSVTLCKHALPLHSLLTGGEDRRAPCLNIVSSGVAWADKKKTPAAALPCTLQNPPSLPPILNKKAWQHHLPVPSLPYAWAGPLPHPTFPGWDLSSFLNSQRKLARDLLSTPRQVFGGGLPHSLSAGQGCMAWHCMGGFSPFSFCACAWAGSMWHGVGPSDYSPATSLPPSLSLCPGRGRLVSSELLEKFLHET